MCQNFIEKIYQIMELSIEHNKMESNMETVVLFGLYIIIIAFSVEEKGTNPFNFGTFLLKNFVIIVS